MIGIVFLVTPLLTLALFTVAQGGVAWATFRHLRGPRAGMGALLREGFRRGFFVLVLVLLAGVPIALGLFLLVVPGVLLATAWAACVPACVVERLGPIASLARSADLTRGHRAQVFLGVLGVMGAAWAAAPDDRRGDRLPRAARGAGGARLRAPRDRVRVGAARRPHSRSNFVARRFPSSIRRSSRPRSAA